MSDKDLLVVVSEMLRKQDHQAEKLEEHSEILNDHTVILNEHTGILNKHTEVLNKHTGLIMETNETLRRFVDIPVQQFEAQQQFNTHFLKGLNKLSEAFMNQTDFQNRFNERFLSKLDEIAGKL